MKAKQYAEKLKADLEKGREPAKAVTEILNDFFKEADHLGKMRRVSTDAGLAAILREQSQKWRAFARLVTGIAEDGFYLMVQEIYQEKPEVLEELRKNGFVG
jgi:hypothetical protein